MDKIEAMEELEKRIEKLETDMAYMQDTIAQLNEIVTKEELLVAKLEKQNQMLAKKVEDLDTEARPNRKPPHY